MADATSVPSASDPLGGVKLVVRNSAGSPMPAAGRLALCGGVALYATGVAAFQLRVTGELDRLRPLLAVALLVLFAVTGGVAADVVAAAIAALTAALCLAESRPLAPSGGGPDGGA